MIFDKTWSDRCKGHESKTILLMIRSNREISLMRTLSNIPMGKRKDASVWGESAVVFSIQKYYHLEFQPKWIVFHADSDGSELRCGGRINIFVIDETLFHEILFVFPHEVIHVS